MYNFNKKQKIIIGILSAIIFAGICYYVYAKDVSYQTEEIQESLKITNEEEAEEEYSDDVILVHVSGAVNKEGVVELKINSRISDAIDKARRIQRRCLY